MKFITSPLVIILVATLLGVGLSSYLVLKRIPEYAAMAAAMRPKPKVIPSHLPDRPPPVDVTSRAVSELKLARDQLAVREAAGLWCNGFIRMVTVVFGNCSCRIRVWYCCKSRNVASVDVS